MNTRKLSVALILAAGAMSPIAASAQAVGTYTGSSADGQYLSFTVATNPTTQAPELTSTTIFFNTTCPNGAPSDNAGIGYAANIDFANGKLKSVSGLPTNLYLDFNLGYNKTNQTLTGYITAVTAQLAASTGTPRKSYVCNSPKQSLTATLQPAAASQAALAPTHGAYVYDRRGRIIGILNR